MQNCSYCGRENEDVASFCAECGTSLTEPAVQIALTTPHQMMREVQQSIWDHFALKRRQFYFAGVLIGALGGLVTALKHGTHFWLPLAGGVLGFAAVGLVTLLERWQARLTADRARGQSTAWKSVIFVFGSLLALIAVTLAFAGFVLLCTQ
jgi:hypothetical protein